MRILWLLPILPYPPDTGGKQDPYFMLRECNRFGDEITAGIIYHESVPPEVPGEFAELVKEIEFLKGNLKKVTARLFASLGDDIPFKFRKYHNETSVKKVAELLQSEPGFDAVIIDHLHLAPLALDGRALFLKSGEKTPPFVLRTPNVESNIVVKYAERMDNPLIKTFAENEAKKMKKYEARVLPQFDLVAAISPVDMETFQDMVRQDANIISVTAGVDVDEWTPSGIEPTPGEVAYVGSFDWQPNVDGALWMIDKVWPTILEKFPEAHLSLVGRKPPPYLEKKQCDNISVTGRVESVAEYVQKASCIAVPLWIGSGMRLKILEAFAYERPVVSTSLGAEGIEAVDGEHIIIRDDPYEFANAVVEILSDPREKQDHRFEWKKARGREIFVEKCHK